MAGNSQRRGAVRKAGTKKGPKVGSGGVRRRGLEGPGRHTACAQAAQPSGGQTRGQGGAAAAPPTEAHRRHRGRAGPQPRAGMPARGRSRDGAVRGARCRGRRTADRIRKARSRCRHRDPGGAARRPGPDQRQRTAPGHRAAGAALRNTPTPTICSRSASNDSAPALLVALDNISDPRNLGAIVRSVSGFGGHGVLIPQRRSASVTAVAWRTSAGAAARVPVARATNLNRTLKNWQRLGPAGRRARRGQRHHARRA